LKEVLATLLRACGENSGLAACCTTAMPGESSMIAQGGAVAARESIYRSFRHTAGFSHKIDCTLILPGKNLCIFMELLAREVLAAKFCRSRLIQFANIMKRKRRNSFLWTTIRWLKKSMAAAY
jgi:hypothetical protein